MELTTNNLHSTNSPSSSTSSTTANHASTTDPMQSWWESVSKARSRILSLATLLPSTSSFSLSSLADSDRPALSFLSSLDAYNLLASSLSKPGSGSGSDPLCQWLYETYLSSDPHLRLVVISFVPLISNLYLSRIHNSDSANLPSLAGFEAVLLAIYSSEVKSRGGKPVLVQIPDLSQPSLYHQPRKREGGVDSDKGLRVGVLSPPLEAQVAVKSTKRPVIVGIAFDCYFNVVSQMPSWSKVELCRYLGEWSGLDCVCKDKFDRNLKESERLDGYFLEGNEIEIVRDEMEKLGIKKKEENNGVRIPLQWEMLQPLLRILGNCLLGPLSSQDVKDAASVAVRRLYARASHDLNPQVIMATRSLIQLDNRAREAAKAAAATANSSSNVNTPSKAKKPEVLLVSK